MAEVFPRYDVFINHRGPDVKKTLASLIYRALGRHGLKVFLDKQELQVGECLTPAIRSAISSASVQIAIFSQRYAESNWCLNELLWMFDSHSSNIIPIFYDIRPSDLRYVDKGEYAGAFQYHRNKGRVSIQQVESWITVLKQVADISGVEVTKEDDLGDRLEEIVEIVLKKVRVEELDVGQYAVGLHQAAEHFEKEVLNPSQQRGINAVGIVGLGGSGKSTLVTHLYNSKFSEFDRCCFLSDVRKKDLTYLQQTLLRDLTRDPNLCIEDTRRGRSLIRHRLQGLTRILVVFDDLDNTEHIENLLFVKDVVGNGSLILVTSRDQSLFVSSEMEIYQVKLLDANHAQELFCWHAFRHAEPIQGFQDMVEEFVRMCGGFPLALKDLARQLYNERDPRKWKQHLESLRKRLPKDVLRQIMMDIYETLNLRENEANENIDFILLGEGRDLGKRVLDESNDNGVQCLQTLRYECLVEFHSADIIRRRWLQGEGVIWSTDVGRRANESFNIRMHDLLREMATEITRKELPLRLGCPTDKMVSKRPTVITTTVLKINLHCERCANKVRKAIIKLEGVHTAEPDLMSHKFTVKGTMGPNELAEYLHRETKKRVEIVAHKEEEEGDSENDSEEPKGESKTNQTVITTTILKVSLHCEGCANDVKKAIIKFEGVQSAEPDLKSHTFIVKGTMGPEKLVEYLHRKTKKQFEIVEQKKEYDDESKGDS